MSDPGTDDLGTPVAVPRVERVVSLVPSLTESVAATAPGLLVGATDYCTHPADLDVTRVGGSKYPDLILDGLGSGPPGTGRCRQIPMPVIMTLR